ncbi:MAG: hypothetical protein H5U24_04960 [Thioclava marina]|uniref:Hint domain-containing protein n=1 Tax=Thioclava marina TaxID=1915077 RepID=UPI001986246C|nr:Hint domain-containing protein [Thioclava marina]MBC7144739.1 hypothetical protein [Thioclava marina]
MTDTNANTGSTTQSFREASDFVSGQTGSIISATGDIIDLDTGGRLGGRVLGPAGLAVDIGVRSLDEDGLTLRDTVAAGGGFLGGILTGAGIGALGGGPVTAILGGFVGGFAVAFGIDNFPTVDDRGRPVSTWSRTADGGIERQTHQIIGSTWMNGERVDIMHTTTIVRDATGRIVERHQVSIPVVDGLATLDQIRDAYRAGGDSRGLVQECFTASTPIAISLTQTRPISDIRVGDTVLAFDPTADLGRGALVPRKVVRLYRNTTEEWVKLTWSEGGQRKELIATPGHHFLDRFGNFPTIEEMLKNGKATVMKNWLKGLLGVGAVCVLAACSTLEENVLVSSTGNCQSSAIESAIHGNWRRQTLSMLELSRGPGNDRTYAELIEARQMQALVTDYSNSLERDRASCRSEASIQFVPQDDRFASSVRRIGFSVDADGRACVRSIDASNNQYCEQ